MSFKNNLSLVLCYLILILPMSCRNRVKSSQVSNVDLESTYGFSDLPDEMRTNALSVQKYLNSALKYTGLKVFDMNDTPISLEEYGTYDRLDKGNQFYFVLESLGLKNMGMQFIPRVDVGSEILFVKIQSIDIRDKQVVKNSGQILRFDSKKLQNMFVKEAEYSGADSELAEIREKITSSSIASYHHFTPEFELVKFLPRVVLAMASGLIWGSFAAKHILKSKTAFTVVIIGVVGMAVALMVDRFAAPVLNGIADKTVETSFRSNFLPESWEENHFLLDEAVSK